jgi:hypothetical protein
MCLHISFQYKFYVLKNYFIFAPQKIRFYATILRENAVFVAAIPRISGKWRPVPWIRALYKVFFAQKLIGT